LADADLSLISAFRIGNLYGKFSVSLTEAGCGACHEGHRAAQSPDPAKMIGRKTPAIAKPFLF
jgi:hypothetical protein